MKIKQLRRLKAHSARRHFEATLNDEARAFGHSRKGMTLADAMVRTIWEGAQRVGFVRRFLESGPEYEALLAPALLTLRKDIRALAVEISKLNRKIHPEVRLKERDWNRYWHLRARITALNTRRKLMQAKFDREKPAHDFTKRKKLG